MDPETITAILKANRENFTEDIVREYGPEIIVKLKKFGPLVKAGKLSIYDFVAELKITYIEAFSLLSENGYI